jgi:FMN phosphatase YigB (HAD superfamily)
MIRLVITDLDNTLYDWVGAHVPAFNAMLDELELQTELAPAVLLDSFRRVHQRYRTSEYAFGVLELDVLARRDRDLDNQARLEKYRRPLRAFYRTRDANLRLYDGVAETLRQLKDDGKVIVAHTDAMMLYASSRVSQLGLEGVLDGLFAVTDHPLPNGVMLPDVSLDGGRSRSRSSIAVQQELDVLKPDPKVLGDILSRFDIDSDEAVYIGDSLSRDVLLAQQAGIADVFARYGPSYDSALYQRLVEITHWTADDVTRETELQRHQVTPSHVVDSFRELTDVIETVDAAPRRSAAAAPLTWLASRMSR